MELELLAKLQAQNAVIQQLIYRLREVKGFQMMGLLNDLHMLENQFDNSDMPEEAITAAVDELQIMQSAVQFARGKE